MLGSINNHLVLRITNPLKKVYYGKWSLNGENFVLDPNLLKLATSEYALHAVNQVLHLVSEKDVTIQVSIVTLAELIVDADGTFDDEIGHRNSSAEEKVGQLHYDGQKC
jgi:hypothetical protein